MTQGFFFVVFVVILAILLLQLLLNAARRQDTGPTRTRGTRVAAVVSAVLQRGDPSMPDDEAALSSDSWYIQCEWTDPRSGTIYTFRSASVDTATASAHPIGSPIAVLIAPGNPDSYFVEVAEP